MVSTNLDRLLTSIGKAVFVEYFRIFGDFSLSSDEVAALLPSTYSLPSRRTRTSHARRIFRERLCRDALERIAASERLSSQTVSRARVLLDHLQQEPL